MTTSLEKLESLVGKAEEVRKGSEYQASLAAALAEVKRFREGPLGRLEALELVLEALATCKGFPAARFREFVVALRKAGNAILATMDASGLRDLRFPVHDVETAIARMSDLLADVWQKQVEGELSPLAQLGELLAGIPATAQAGRELSAFARGLLAASNRLPTRSELETWGQRNTDQRLKSLESLGVDERIRKFLQRAAQGTATAADIDAGILNWLQATQGAAARFKIRL